MNDAFVLKGRVELDTSDFDSKTDEVARKAKEIAQDSGDAGRQAGDFWRDAFSFSTGQLLSDGLKATWEFAKQTAKESIDLASDLQEVQNVVDVTFGDGAKQINSWARTTLSTFGMSELSAKKYVSTMGAMLKSMGMTDDAAQEMSVDVVSLAADMASFYNMDHEEIMTKIRSGFAGEIEPLRQLGINMSVANLEAFALSRGMDKTYKSMTQAEQATLRYQFLMANTADAQGDFARTSDSYANSVKFLSESLQELKTSVGEGLLDIIAPTLAEVADVLRGNPVMKQLEEIKKQESSDIATANHVYGQAEYLINQLAAMEGTAAEQSDEWNASLQALVKTMPELGKYIDTTTGKIMVNTEELLKHADTVRDLAIYEARENAMGQYEQALYDAEKAREQYKQDLAVKKSDLAVWQADYDALLDELADRTGLDRAYIYTNHGNWVGDSALKRNGITQEELDELWRVRTSGYSVGDEIYQIKKSADEYDDNVETAQRHYEAAQKALAAVDPLNEAKAEYNDALAEEEAALEAARAKAYELAEAYAELKASARSSMEGVTGGWKNMTDAMTTRTALSGNDGLIAAIESEAKYMEEYSKNLQTAMTMGLDADFIAKLSDGSEQSYSILSSLVGASDTQIEEIKAAWAAYEEQLAASSETMATAQAEVDVSIQTMKGELDNLIEDMNQKETARDNMAQTVKGMDAGWNEEIGNLKSDVMEFTGFLASQFSRSYKIRVDGVDYQNGAEVTTASNSKGLDYVPYNDYLTYLHKGEAILTAAEAERYRSGAANTVVIDYDRLAATIAESLSGSLVQLDGRAVGELVAPTVSRAIQQNAQQRRYG